MIRFFFMIQFFNFIILKYIPDRFISFENKNLIEYHLSKNILLKKLYIHFRVIMIK